MTSVFYIHKKKNKLDTIFPQKLHSALASVAQWIEHWPVNQRVTGLIPSQGTGLGFGPGPQWGACKRQPHIDVSFPLFLPSFL